MATKALTTNLYHFYTTQLNPMTDAQIAKQHGLSLDELEDWKEKNSIQPKGVTVEEKKHSRTVSILDKDKPPLTLELYKGYKELAKPISDNAIGNEHGMSVGDMQKFKREHDLIGKYGKNTKEAVEKRAEPAENVTAAPESKKLPEIVRIKEKAPEAVEEPQVEEYEMPSYREEEDEHKNDAFETEEALEEEFKPQDSTAQLADVLRIDVMDLSEEDAKKLMGAAATAQLEIMHENPEFTTFRNDYTPSDAQSAEMKKLRQELERLRREQEWLENRHVQDTAIVESVNEKIKQQEADRKQWDIMRNVFANLKDLRREHIKLHGYAPIPHQERMTRLLSTLGVIAGQDGKEDYEQYVNLLVLASEVLAHAEQLRGGGNIAEF